MAQTGSVKSRLAILIAAFVIVVIGGITAAYSFSAYNNLTATIARSDELSREEHHSEAITLLQSTQDSLLMNLLGIKESEIKNRLGELDERVRLQGIYQQALDQKRAGEREAAIQLLSGIPEDSFYSHRAKLEIADNKQSILEAQLASERTAREVAEDNAAAEERAKLLAEAKASEEARLRAIEEAAKKSAEANAREEARLRANEEAARRRAEQKAESQRLAKERQQRETEAQRQRANQEEKARIIELAKTHPRIKAIVSGELKFYIDPLPPYASHSIKNAVEEVASSFASWSPYGADVRRVYNRNDADMAIFWVRDYGPDILGEAIFQANVKVGLGSNNCMGEWRAFDANTVTKVLWHEIGHSIGFGHSNDPNNVMYYETASKFEIESEISEVIAGGWYYTFALCGSGHYSYSFESENPDIGFNIFVLPPGSDPNAISTGGAKVYLGCGEKGMYRYTGSCSVANGSSIYILNTSYSTAIRLSGRIISLDNPPWPNMTWDPDAYRYDEVQLADYWHLFHSDIPLFPAKVFSRTS